jgi:toxin ParE1/3/4
MIQRPYLVLYAIHPDTNDATVDEVEIVRIVDGRRDLPRLV